MTNLNYLKLQENCGFKIYVLGVKNLYLLLENLCISLNVMLIHGGIIVSMNMVRRSFNVKVLYYSHLRDFCVYHFALETYFFLEIHFLVSNKNPI